MLLESGSCSQRYRIQALLRRRLLCTLMVTDAGLAAPNVRQARVVHWLTRTEFTRLMNRFVIDTI
jgi:hypothetical protein